MNFSSTLRIRRNGISLFEVLIAILVASIGVFGVLVLIPFAVKNAQNGMDGEAAINAAKNFYADFQAYGYHDPAFWNDDDYTPPLAAMQLPPPAPPAPQHIVPGWPYVIDPVGVSTIVVAGGTAYGQFPGFTGMRADFPQLNRITLLNLATSPVVPIDQGLSRRLCMPQDTLVFDKPSTDLGPPEQKYYELDAGNVPVGKRQYNGKYTLAAFVVPLNDDMNYYKMYTLVIGTGDREKERVFELDKQPTIDVAPPGRQFEGIALGGGDLTFSQEFNGSANPKAIRNNDWMMLISYMDEPGTFNDVKLDFYRVIHADGLDVTVQGPDFDVFRDWPTAGNITQVNTYAVLIPNVLAVYERTFRTEPNSDWFQ